MKKLKLSTAVFFLFFTASAQNYTSYFTGDTSDVTTPASGVTVLMGGATENDNAMKWFLQHSGGGDIVVLRASGSNGYNTYLYSLLGVSVNSVQSIVFNNASASTDPYVIRQIRNAEALWIAGGNQWDYVSYWKNTPIASAINYLINEKKVPVGGTSAGMAVMGHIAYTAQYASVTSAAALANPYNTNVTLLKDDFILNPWLDNVITDTHYNNPDRKGRHVTFLARIMQDYNEPVVFGIACNEYVAVCIDTNGMAYVYGSYPSYQDFAYFLQANCTMPNKPETCQASQPLTWNRNAQAVKVYQVPGIANGANSFNLANWKTGVGGSWQDWYVVNGVLQTITPSAAPDCNPITSLAERNKNVCIISLFPNPVTDILNFTYTKNYSIEIYDIYSKLILQNETNSTPQINVSGLKQGYYFLVIKSGNQIFNARFIKIDK